MLSAPSGRGLRRAPAALKHRLARQLARRRVQETLAGFSDEDRAIIALLLLERLTPAEAARALDREVTDVARSQRAVLTRLRQALRGRRVRTTRSSERDRALPLRVREA